MTNDTLTQQSASSQSPTPDSSSAPVPPPSAPQQRPGITLSLNDPARCHFRYPNGRRCALPGLPAKSGLCLCHYNRQVAAGHPLLPAPNDSEDLSADLLSDLSEFESGDDVLKFLARLLVLVTKGRVSPRRAAVLAYISNQLLHSHRAIDKELANEPQQIVFDLPRPKRDEPE